MKTYTLVFLFCLAFQAQAQTIITPQGNYVYSQSGSTTYVTGPNTNSNTGVSVAVPVTVNSVTGIGQVHTPSGSYLIQRSGSTTTVIPTSRGR